jgi:hypothetical protein
MVSMSCLRAWTTSELERRSGTISGRCGQGARRARGARRGACAPAREELGQELGQLLRVGVLERDDLQLAQRHLDVHQVEHLEEPADVGGAVGDDQEIRLAVRGEGALGGHERAQQRDRVLGADELEWDHLAHHLVVGQAGAHLPADDGLHGGLGGVLPKDDPVQVAGAHRGETVDVEDGEQHREDLVARDLAHRLDFPAARRGREHVVETHDLGGGLDHDLHVGVVEVQHELPRGRARGRRRRRRRRFGRRR